MIWHHTGLYYILDWMGQNSRFLCHLLSSSFLCMHNSTKHILVFFMTCVLQFDRCDHLHPLFYSWITCLYEINADSNTRTHTHTERHIPKSILKKSVRACDPLSGEEIYTHTCSSCYLWHSQMHTKTTMSQRPYPWLLIVNRYLRAGLLRPAITHEVWFPLNQTIEPVHNTSDLLLLWDDIGWHGKHISIVVGFIHVYPPMAWPMVNIVCEVPSPLLFLWLRSFSVSWYPSISFAVPRCLLLSI